MRPIQSLRTIVLMSVACLLATTVSLTSPNVAEAATGRVITTNGTPIYVRSGPSSSASVIGSLPQGATVSFSCYLNGDAVTGPYGTETIWNRLDSGGFVSDSWLSTNSNGPIVPLCDSSPAPNPAPTPTPAPPAPNQFRIAWTSIGIYPRASTSMGSTKIGNALQDGTVITVACETKGETVSDKYTSNIWEKLDNGTYVPNVYVNTGVNGWTPGIPRCGTPSPKPLPQSRYNRTAAVAFAQAHWNDQPRFAEDCTWFASQTLWTGGLPKSEQWTDRTWDLTRLASRRYYPGPTKVATFADTLKDYLVSSDLATVRQLSWQQNSVPDARVGDLIAYDWGHPDGHGNLVLGNDGQIDHLMIITTIKPNGYPEVTGHTTNTQLTGWTWSRAANDWWENAYKAPGYGPPKVFLIHVLY